MAIAVHCLQTEKHNCHYRVFPQSLNVGNLSVIINGNLFFKMSVVYVVKSSCGDIWEDCGVSHISGATNLLSKDVFSKIELWFWPSKLFLLGDKSKKCKIEEATNTVFFHLIIILSLNLLLWYFLLSLLHGVEAKRRLFHWRTFCLVYLVYLVVLSCSFVRHLLSLPSHYKKGLYLEDVKVCRKQRIGKVAGKTESAAKLCRNLQSFLAEKN